MHYAICTRYDAMGTHCGGPERDASFRRGAKPDGQGCCGSGRQAGAHALATHQDVDHGLSSKDEPDVRMNQTEERPRLCEQRSVEAVTKAAKMEAIPTLNTLLGWVREKPELDTLTEAELHRCLSLNEGPRPLRR